MHQVLQYTFPRELRLLTPSQFQNVFSQAARFHSKNLTIFARKNNEVSARLGFAITKKNIKLACQRNRIKRIVRESFRQNQHQLHPVDFVILSKKNTDQLQSEQINQQIEQLWRKIENYYNK